MAADGRDSRWQGTAGKYWTAVAVDGSKCTVGDSRQQLWTAWQRVGAKGKGGDMRESNCVKGVRE